MATPVNVTYKSYLTTLSDVTEALFATPASAVYKLCLASPVDVSQALLGYPGIYIQLFLSGTITTLLQSPSPTYMFRKGTIGLNCEWSPVGSSVVLQSSIS